MGKIEEQGGFFVYLLLIDFLGGVLLGVNTMTGRY